MKKKRLSSVLIATHNMAGGGCERVVAQLANYFVQQGVACTIVTEYRCESFYALDEAVGFLPMLEKSSCGARDIPRAYRNLRRIARRIRPDVVLAMPEKVNVWAVMALLPTRFPVVVSERNDPHRHPESRVKRMLRTLFYPFAAGFIFQTRQAMDYFPAGIRGRGAVLDNPLDLERIPAPCNGSREKTVTAVGRLGAQKNFPLLIRAFARFYETHPDYRLIIYGEGEDRPMLEALSNNFLPDGACLLPGADKRVVERIRKSGMFVLSSDFEGMPNALIEAMAVGLPCIAADCPIGGPASLIRNEINGLLIPVGDEAALAAAMSRIADDAAFAARLGKNAETIKQRMDESIVAEKWRAYLAKAARLQN